MSEHLPIQRWVIRHVAGDAYIDKEPEGSWVTYPDHLAALRACEERVINAAINAVREAIGEEWHDEFVPKDKYDCCGCSSYNGIVNDATAAIDDLRGDS